MVTKLNGELFYINPYEIEFIEETPDTVISMKSGKKMLVSEKAKIVINRMIDFYRLANFIPKSLSEQLPEQNEQVDETALENSDEEQKPTEDIISDEV